MIRLTSVALAPAVKMVSVAIIMVSQFVHVCLVSLEMLRLVGPSVSYHLNVPLIRRVKIRNV